MSKHACVSMALYINIIESMHWQAILQIHTDTYRYMYNRYTLEYMYIYVIYVQSIQILTEYMSYRSNLIYIYIIERYLQIHV